MVAYAGNDRKSWMSFPVVLCYRSDGLFRLFQSVDPGQQFTWENSNLEVNKPKNRYANVIAYDHSRVLLSSVDGEITAASDGRFGFASDPIRVYRSIVLFVCLFFPGIPAWSSCCCTLRMCLHACSCSNLSVDHQSGRKTSPQTNEASGVCLKL